MNFQPLLLIEKGGESLLQQVKQARSGKVRHIIVSSRQ